MRKSVVLLIFILCGAILISGCIQQRRASYSKDVLAKIERIRLIKGEPTRPYIELGIVEQKFNPLDSKAEIKFTLQEQAYSKYGDVDAIIRISELMVTGYEFPLRLVRGIAIKYTKEVTQ